MTRSATMFVRLSAAMALLAAAGCKSELKAQRWGGCMTSGADHCGVVLSRGNDTLDLTCDTGPKPPPNPHAPLPLPLKCRCVENSVEKKTVSLTEPVRDDLDSDRAVRTAQTACGW